MALIETGLNTMLFRKLGEKSVRKQVIELPDLERSGFSHVPERQDYERLVGSSIEFLMEPRWGIADSIPNCQLVITDDSRWASGCSCIVNMDWIEGRSLSGMDRVDEVVAGQLVKFLDKCGEMAEVTRKEAGFPVLPDLLGGVNRPKDRFWNFVVENDTKRLFFVDVYPLAVLDSFVKRRRYKGALGKAARATGSVGVGRAVEGLIEKL